MHNTPKANLEFKITWTESNLRWLLGESPRNEALILKTRKLIQEMKKELKVTEVEA